MFSPLILLLAGHIWGKEKWSYKTGDLVKEVQLICLRQDKKNMTALAGSTICLRKTKNSCLLRRDL